MEETSLNSSEERIKVSPLLPCRFSVQFLGSMFMDPLYSQTMQPWVMAEVRRRKKYVPVVLEVVEGTIRISSKVADQGAKTQLFEHHLKGVTHFAKLHQERKCFAYLTRHQLDDNFVCHVYLADSEEVIPQIFQALREASKGITGQSAIDSNNSVAHEGDGNSSKSLFEVKYIGGVKVGGKKVTSDDIDNLAEKMLLKLEEREQERTQLKEQAEEDRRRRRHESEASIHSLPDTLENLVDDLTIENKLEKQKKLLKKASHSEPGLDVLSPVALNKVIDFDGSLGCGIQALSVPLLEGAADSRYQTEQPVALLMDYESDTDSSRDSLSTSEQSLNHPVENGWAQRGLCFSSLAGDVSQRRHSSQLEIRHESELKSSFQEPSYNRQLWDGSDSHNTVDNVVQEVGQVMLLQLGQQEITLFSLDRKMATLECRFKDISSVSQGSQKQDIFGIVVRESESRFICHVLNCLSASVVAEIMGTLQKEFATAYSRRGSATTNTTGNATSTQHQVCTACPLHQLHQICQEINTMPSQMAYDLLVKKVQLLPDMELNELNSYMQMEAPESFEDSTEVMMIFLRRLYERKQKAHIHISEKSNSYRSATHLPEDKNMSESLKNKAKKSFTKSFENLLSRSKRKDDGLRNIGWTSGSDTSLVSKDSSSTFTPDASSISKEYHHSFPSPTSSPRPLRKRSVTLGSLNSHSDLQHIRTRTISHDKPASSTKTVILPATKYPHLSESLSSSSISSPQEDTSPLASPRRPSRSWRKAIFNRVCTPQHSGDHGGEVHSLGYLHNMEEIRAMWKKAFLQTLILIRLEKENHNIRARQEEEGATLSRRLEYQELTPCLREITAVWEKMLSLQEREVEEEGMEDVVMEEETTVPHTKLVESVKKGVPRSLRGQIWLFLIQQHQMSGATPDCSYSSTSYEDLLKQLTTHQHAILIDLGRTFPSHPYFSTALGPGQLELFNLLKAYSLLDPEVGYCQGLSFIVGVLLMHMEEISAFHVLKYMMYDLGLRKQFRPNMTALQMKLYQLTRLLHDHYKDVYDHFETHEISPTLYAAPWFLTLFASQFPLGFVARVFDMIFVQGIDSIFKVALMLIGNHRALILQCNTFETVVDFLKITLPEMVQVQMERIINQAFELNIENELQAFKVEYHVLSEEMMFSSPQHNHHHNQRGKVLSSLAGSATQVPHSVAERRRMSIDLEMLYRLEHQNRTLKHQNTELLEKLQEAQSQRDSCELSVTVHQVERDKLRSHIQALELERAALLTAVSKLQKLVPPETLQHFSLSLPATSPTSPSHTHLVEVSDDTHSPSQTESQVSQAGQADLQPHESGASGQVATFPDTPTAGAARDPEACLVAADTTPVTSSHKSQSEQTLPALNVSSCEISSSQKTLLTTCEQDDHCMSELRLDDAAMLLSCSLADVDDRSKKLPCAPQSLSQTELHMSTTVSSPRQTYACRSISNVTGSLPGSVSPDERRKSVKVIVQHSPTARSLQQMSGSQR